MKFIRHLPALIFASSLTTKHLKDQLTSAITERTWLNKQEAEVVLAVIEDHLKTHYPQMNTVIASVLEHQTANSGELSESD